MRKFGRETNQRKAFLKSLADNLVIKGKIKTTEARAKELRSLIERVITRAKQNDLAGQRFVIKSLSKTSAKKLTKEIAPRFKERSGGYVRLTRLGQRLSDGAKMAFVEFIK